MAGMGSVRPLCVSLTDICRICTEISQTTCFYVCLTRICKLLLNWRDERRGFGLEAQCPKSSVGMQKWQL